MSRLPLHPMTTPPRARQAATLAVITLIAALSASCGRDDVMPNEPDPDPVPDTTAPTLDRTAWQTGLTNPWDIAFLPDSTALITERPGRLRARRPNGTLSTVATLGDVVATGEGGLLGLAVDPAFATNRYVYLCFSSNISGSNDNRVVRWRLAADLSALTDRTDLVTGMPHANGGRHSGCRPRFGPDGYLWIGTGDAAVGANPQNPASLGGKVLRITRDGLGAPGNSILAGGETRVYTVGHRNVQGIAFHPVGGAAYAVEHGPSRDDEVTRLEAGRNAGWNPVPGYNESVPMTDVTAYPTALPPTWTSGSPARGTSGATFLRGAQWKRYENALVIAQLVGAKLVVLELGANGALARETPLFANLGTRLRVPVQGPDGALYVATDVGGTGGQIWRIAPQ